MRAGVSDAVASARTRLGPGGVAGLAVVVALAGRVAAWVRRGTVVQFTDYWLLIDETVKVSGWVSVRGLVRLHNGHMLVVPKLLYWANLHVSGGSNVVLGYVVVVIVVAQVVVLALLVPRREVAHPLVAAALVAVAGSLLLAPHGAWSFLLAMSGAAWLLANGCAVVAIWAARHGRTLVAAAAAATAAASYGTGVWAFPAALLVGVIASPRRWRRQWPLVLGGAATALAYRLAPSATPSAPRLPVAVTDLLEYAARNVGGLLAPADGAIALALGALALAGGPLLAALAVRSRPDAAAPWVGAFAYGALAGLAIAYGRAGLAPPGTSRYGSLAAFVWIGLAGLLVVLAGRHVVATLPLALLALVSGLHDRSQVDAIHARAPHQDNLAAAFQVGVADGSRTWMPWGEVPPITDKLRAIAHHPFDGRWDADCGLLGEEVDEGETMALATADARGGVLSWGPSGQLRGTVVEGWVAPGDHRVRCVVAADADGLVVGVGKHGFAQPLREAVVGEADIGFVLVAPPDLADGQVYVVFEGSDVLHTVPVG